MKTISVDLDAYQRLQQARLGPKESFSEVIKRAHWGPTSSTGAALLAALEEAPLPDQATLNWLEATQQEDAPEDAWIEQP